MLTFTKLTYTANVNIYNVNLHDQMNVNIYHVNIIEGKRQVNQVTPKYSNKERQNNCRIHY